MVLMFTLSVIMVCSSFSLWSMWLGLEVLNFFIIPWLMEESNSYKSSKVYFYFITQAVGSGFFLISMLNSYNIWFYSILWISLLIKLGSFPFHFWVAPMIENMDWMKFSFLMTMSKMGPLSVLCMFNPLIIFVKMTWGGLVIPFFGLKSISIRKVMTYSSIAHMSWIITVVFMSKSLLVFFIVSYWWIFYLSCFFMKLMNLNSFKDLACLDFSFLELTMIFSLMGCPPFLGFFPKMYTMKMMCSFKMIVESAFMSLLSIIPLFFYLKMIVMMMLSFEHKNISFFMLFKTKKNSFLILLLSFLSLEVFLAA